MSCSTRFPTSAPSHLWQWARKPLPAPAFTIWSQHGCVGGSAHRTLSFIYSFMQINILQVPSLRLMACSSQCTRVLVSTQEVHWFYHSPVTVCPYQRYGQTDILRVCRSQTLHLGSADTVAMLCILLRLHFYKCTLTAKKMCIYFFAEGEL